MKKIIDLYKALPANTALLPTNTSFTWWDDVYKTTQIPVYDREFVRRYSDFLYYDFLEDDDNALTDFKADVLSILTINQKKYAEMYRIFVLSDDDMPITYNYDMTEITGAQHTEDKFGATSFTKGEQENIDGEVTNSHNVAPFNSSVATTAESSDVKTSQTYTDGSRTDTTEEHTDEHDADEWTLTRKGNIGTQTAADVANSFVKFFDNSFKFMLMVYEDICKQLLLIGD